jgi:hypothetical protein
VLVQVLYCIRPEDSLENFSEFLESLRSYPATNASIHVLCKADSSSHFYRSAQDLIRTRAMYIELHSMEDSGFDIGTYRQHILKSAADVFILMSATSRPRKRNWVDLLISPIIDGNSSVTGAMASLESLRSTFFVDLSVGVVKRMSELFSSIKKISVHQISVKMLNACGSFLILPFFLFHPVYSCKRFFFFSKFPNPHLRTTGMAITRDLFLQVVTRQPKKKIDVLLLESGRKGFCKKLSQDISKPIVVIPQGHFELGSHEATLTFRSENKDTAIVTDAHFENYLGMNSASRSFIRKSTWNV